MVRIENLCFNDFDEDPLEGRSANMGRGSGKRARLLRNPFLNYVRDFRKGNGNLRATEIASRAAEKWRNMSSEEKSPYCEMARRAPRRRKRARRRRRVRRD